MGSTYTRVLTVCVFCFLGTEQRQRRKERRAAMQTDQVVKILAAE